MFSPSSKSFTYEPENPAVVSGGIPAYVHFANHP
jgi:hypothetical protein